MPEPLSPPGDETRPDRLQRVLANHGIASRRGAEVLITDGRVRVNGQVVTTLGTRADPAVDTITVDGRRLPPLRLRYLILNKPAGFITTTSDERARRTVMDLIAVSERVYPVGRLDRSTEGLLLLTNDGDLANRVMHPRYGLRKEYHVLVPMRPSPAAIQRVRDGVWLDGKRVEPDEFRILRETSEGVWLSIVLHEGMTHVVRRIMESVELEIVRLMRVRVGPVSVAGLASGAWRDMSPGELASLEEAVHRTHQTNPPETITSIPAKRRPR